MYRLERHDRDFARPVFAASAFCEGHCFEGLVRNLTPRGAMFESIHHLAVGAQVCLDIQGLDVVPSSVVWSIGPRAGLSFDAPLSDLAEQQPAAEVNRFEFC